jgi:hypothetical protein
MHLCPSLLCVLNVCVSEEGEGHKVQLALTVFLNKLLLAYCVKHVIIYFSMIYKSIASHFGFFQVEL